MKNSGKTEAKSETAIKSTWNIDIEWPELEIEWDLTNIEWPEIDFKWDTAEDL